MMVLFNFRFQKTQWKTRYNFFLRGWYGQAKMAKGIFKVAQWHLTRDTGLALIRMD